MKTTTVTTKTVQKNGVAGSLRDFAAACDGVGFYWSMAGDAECQRLTHELANRLRDMAIEYQTAIAATVK